MECTNIDDEIDIEEHDILEDPRIKTLFPDFSQVKLEVHENGALFADQIMAEEEQEEECNQTIDNTENNTSHDEIIIPDIQNSFTDVKNIVDTVELSDDVEEIPYDPVQEYETITDEKVLNDKDVIYDKTNYGEPIVFEDSPVDLYSNQSDINVKQEIEYDCDDELPPEDIYHFKNKIILGTKPPICKQQKLNDAAMRKEFLPVSVVLEDWAEKLENSTYCKQCQRLFATENALDAHKMTTHSLLVAITKNKALKSTSKQNVARKSTSPRVKVKNQARKSTGTVSSRFCNHCSKEFLDHTALIKHLYELLPLNNFPCNKCNEVFNNQKELIDHNMVHVKPEASKVLKKKVKGKPQIVKKKVQTAKSKVVSHNGDAKVSRTIQKANSKKKILFEEDIRLRKIFVIPKSVLFECGTCKLNFLTSIAAKIHNDTCNGEVSLPFVNCEICKKKIKVENLKEHKRQHEISPSIKTYKVTMNTYNRVLTECPKCQIFFTENSLIVHFRTNKCGKLVKTFCETCDVNISKVSYRNHMERHNKGFTRRDFIFVKNVMQKNAMAKVVASKVGKGKLWFPPKVVASKVGKGNLWLPPKGSTKASPAKSSTAKSSTAKPGPLKSAAKSPHTKSSPTKLVLGKTVPTKSQATCIKAEIMRKNSYLKFNFCPVCKCVCKNKFKLHHMKKKCKNFKKTICDRCGLQVREVELQTHAKLHYSYNINLHELSIVDVVTQKPTKLAMPDYHECKRCAVKFNHRKAMAGHKCGINFKQCECGDMFDLSAYETHAAYHRLAREIPEPKLVKRLDQKIVYKCVSCDVVTDQYDRAVEHSQNHDKIKNNKIIKCYVCNLKFEDTSWQQHKNLHSEQEVRSSDFKVLTYNPEHLLTDEWLKLFQNLSASQTREIIKTSLYSIERSVTMKLVKKGRVEYTLYVCSQCEICFENSEIASHMTEKCQPSHGRCKICSLRFKDSNSLDYHVLLHEGVRNEDFRIVHFLKDSKPFLLYKCTVCYTCVTLKQSVGRHKCPKQNRNFSCHVCGQIYSTAVKVFHEKAHEENPDFVEKNIQLEYFDPKNADAKKAKVFKCDCGLHFASLPSVAKHAEACTPQNKIHAENCSKCGLLFPTDTLVSHLCKHHSNDTKIVIEDYSKVQSSSECTSKPKSPLNDYDYKLYKCGICDIYFVSQTTCYMHALNNPHKSVELPRECHICGLQFTGKSLYIHKRRHHEKYFDLNRVLVEEYFPATEDRPIKIDIFMATDKLQSLLVSSST